MEKKEVVFVLVVIILLAAVLLVSGVFYFNIVFSGDGLTGNVVVESGREGSPGEGDFERNSEDFNG